MPDSGLLEFSAVLGAHEMLIRDLLVSFIVRAEEPLQTFDRYASRIKADLPLVHATTGDATESDLLNQLTTEAIERTLAGARQNLVLAVRQERQRKQGGPPGAQT